MRVCGLFYSVPVAWEIRRLSEEGIPVKLDSIVCVIDAINFKGYEDKSPTAKLQAQYTDIILINKHEEISERELDAVLDDVFEMNPETPKLKTKKGFINADIVVGLDTNLFLAKGNADLHSYDHHDEAKEEVQILDVLLPPVNNTFELIVAFLNKMGEQKDVFFRIKGVVFLEPEEAGLGEKEFTASKSYLGMVEVKTKSAILVNWAFGRYDIVPLASEASILAHDNQHGESKISIMGLRIHDTHNINYIANALTIDKKHVKKLVGSQQHSHDSPNSHL